MFWRFESFKIWKCRTKKFRVLYPTQKNFLLSSFWFLLKISFSLRGKNRGFLQSPVNESFTIPQRTFTHTHAPSVSSPEKMEQQLLLAGRRHASFLCSSSSLSLSKKLKKNRRGGGGGALFKIYFFNRQFFQTSSILSFLPHLSLKLYFSYVL